jgi:hypothetical protein
MRGALARRSWLVGALAVAAAGLIAVLAWRASRPDHGGEPARSSSRPTAAASAGIGAARGPRPAAQPTGRPPPPVQVAPGADAGEPAVSAAAVADAADAHAHLQDHARPCLAKVAQPPPAGFVRFRYTLVVADGEATVEAPEVINHDLPGDLLSCIVARIEETGWQADGTERTGTIDDRLTVEELQ